jgi:hypothetical protein
MFASSFRVGTIIETGEAYADMFLTVIRRTPNAQHPTPKAFGAGADDGIRTRDLRFTKPLLYQLSYVGIIPG